MKNETFRDANFLSLPVPEGTKSGDPVRVGGLNGYAATNRANTSVPPYGDDHYPNPDYDYGGGNVDGNASVWLAGAPTFEDSELEITEVGQEVFLTQDVDGVVTLTTEPDDGGDPTPIANELYGHALTVKTADPGPLTVRIAN